MSHGHSEIASNFLPLNAGSAGKTYQVDGGWLLEETRLLGIGIHINYS